jgi:hypothetical protein
MRKQSNPNKSEVFLSQLCGFRNQACSTFDVLRTTSEETFGQISRSMKFGAQNKK